MADAPRRLGLGSVFLLYIAAATAIGFVDHRSRPYPDRGFSEQVPSVLAGTAEAPGRYRVLAPLTYDRLQRASGLRPGDAWLVFRWLCLFGMLVAGHVYFRTWFSTGAAVAGNFIVAALLPLTFTNSWSHPDHLMEAFLFTLGCACIARRWPWLLLPVIALNALNRETSVFLLPLFLFAARPSRTHISWALAMTALWSAIYIALRIWLGWAPYDLWQARRNFEFLVWFPVERDLYYRLFGWFFVALVLPLVVLIARSWDSQPRFMRVAAGVVTPLFLIVSVLFSSIIETRIFTPLLPLLVPGALVALFRSDEA